MKFTYYAYSSMIDQIKKNNYTICDYHTANETEAPCILRHDVDYSLSKAVEFALFEASLGVKSTYFILVRSEFYNIFTPNSVCNIKTIINQGHEIGLHFDETNYEDMDKDILDIKQKIFAEADILAGITGLPAKVVSMHRPSVLSLEKDYDFHPMINSYSNLYFKSYKYLSDSRMNWRTDPKNTIENKEFKKLHILTHPFWYYEKEKCSQDILIEFVKQGSIIRYENLELNFRDLSEILSKEEVNL